MTNARETTEAQMVGLVRNALLVAGQEMGKDGDHWPVINSTIQSIMKDWENVQTERNVQSALQANFKHVIQELKSIHKDSLEAFKPKIEDAIRQLQEIYDAAFSGANDNETINAEDVPAYIRRAEAIIKTLEDENG